jgi:hypothetical protein
MVDLFFNFLNMYSFSCMLYILPGYMYTHMYVHKRSRSYDISNGALTYVFCVCYIHVHPDDETPPRLIHTYSVFKHDALHPKVGEVPTFRASDTDTNLPTVSTNLFSGLRYLKHRFIASKCKFISDTIASSQKNIHFMLKYRFKAAKSSVSTDTIACVG